MASIKDIARLSGYSITTVSRALNGYSDVNEATRRKIEEVSRQLNYTPNLHAKNLVMQKSNRIGLIVFDFGEAAGEDNFVYELMVGLHQQCLKTGFELIFLFGVANDAQTTSIAKIMQQYDLCGMVIMGCGRNMKIYRELLTIEKPVAMIDGDIHTAYVGNVSVDNYRAGFEATRYLIEQKHRKRILLINGKRDAFASIERLRGYRDALGDAFREEDVFYCEYHDRESADIVERLIVRDGRFAYDAVFATSDMMAVGAETALLAHQIDVGREVDIIGFDNIMLSGYVPVPLTTVAQDRIALGRESVNLLIDIMRKTSDERNIIVAHKLVIRQSA